jgi:hypothetical protein
MGDATERQEGVEEFRAWEIEQVKGRLQAYLYDPLHAHGDVLALIEDHTRLAEALRSERSARLAAEEKLLMATHVAHGYRLDAEEADAAGYRRGLEEAAKVADERAASWKHRDATCAGEAQRCADAIRALPRASSASQGER